MRHSLTFTGTHRAIHRFNTEHDPKKLVKLFHQIIHFGVALLNFQKPQCQGCC